MSPRILEGRAPSFPSFVLTTVHPALSAFTSTTTSPAEMSIRPKAPRASWEVEALNFLTTGLAASTEESVDYELYYNLYLDFWLEPLLCFHPPS